jgi:hypothetical protein
MSFSLSAAVSLAFKTADVYNHITNKPPKNLVTRGTAHAPQAEREAVPAPPVTREQKKALQDAQDEPPAEWGDDWANIGLQVDDEGVW